MAISALDALGLLDNVPADVWVAVSEAQGKVVAFGSDIEAVVQAAQEQGEDRPLMMRKPLEEALLFV